MYLLTDNEESVIISLLAFVFLLPLAKMKLRELIASICDDDKDWVDKSFIVLDSVYLILLSLLVLLCIFVIINRIGDIVQ